MQNTRKIIRNHEPFGKLQIDTTRLLTKNILKVNYITGSIFPNKIIPKMFPISDDFKEILIDLIHTEGENEINETLQAKLSIREQEILKLIIEYSGLASQIKFKPIKRNIGALIDRIKVIQGSIEAGLDNDELIDEFMSIIKILHAGKKISDADYMDLKDAYKDFKK